MRKTIIISLILFLCFSAYARGTTTTGTFTPLVSTANLVPVQSNHLIWDGLTEKTLNATNVNVTSVSMNFTIADPNGNIMDWYIYHNDGGTWRLVDSDIGVGNGTVKTTNVSWFRQTTNYSVSFNITDGVNWSNITRWFVTDYSVPQILNPVPSNGSIVAAAVCSWHVNIADFVPFNWTLTCSNGQTSNGRLDANGTFFLNLTGLTTLTLYTVYVNVTNGNMTSNISFIFTVIIPAAGSHVGGGGGLYVPPPDNVTKVKKVTAKTEADIMTRTGVFILLFVFLIIIVFWRRRREKNEKI